MAGPANKKLTKSARHKSALKRHRQSLKRRTRNRNAKSSLRTVVKSALTFAAAGQGDEAKARTREATKLLDKAAVHGILHKKNAQRKISRLQKAVNAALLKGQGSGKAA